MPLLDGGRMVWSGQGAATNGRGPGAVDAYALLPVIKPISRGFGKPPRCIVWLCFPKLTTEVIRRRCCRASVSDARCLERIAYNVIGVWHRCPIMEILNGSTAARSGDATLGMQGDLFFHHLCPSAVQCAGEWRRLASSLPNLKAVEQMEHLLRIVDAGPRSFAQRAPWARTKCRSLSKMAEALVQRGLWFSRGVPMATWRIWSSPSDVRIYSGEVELHSRKPGACRFCRTLEAVAISPWIFRWRITDMAFLWNAGLPSDTDALQNPFTTSW